MVKIMSSGKREKGEPAVASLPPSGQLIMPCSASGRCADAAAGFADPSRHATTRACCLQARRRRI